MTDRKAFERLSAAEALRALYIDFEGGKDQPPVWLGVHRRGGGPDAHVHGMCTSAAFASLAGDWRSLEDAVRNVVVRAESGDRRIVAWTEHELDVVHSFVDDQDLVQRFEARYANAKRVATRWRNRDHAGHQPADGKLGSWLAMFGYAVPPDGLAGDVGETIRSVEARVSRGLSPTPSQLERWRRLVEHNRHDCIGMRRLMLLATADRDS